MEAHNAVPLLGKTFQLSFLLSKINLYFASPSHCSQPQDAKREGQNLAKLCSGWLTQSYLSEFQILIIFPFLCTLYRRNEWEFITGGVLSPEKNWCSLTKEKWISRLVLCWEARIQTQVSSGPWFYSLIAANQNYLRWITSPETRLISRRRPPLQASDLGQVI